MNIIFIAGLSASGKTTVAQHIGAEMNMPVVSVRDVSHLLAERAGYERTREWVAEIGIPRARVLGMEALAEEVEVEAKKNNRGIIIDDIAHFHIMTFLRDAQNASTFIAQIETNEFERQKRRAKVTFADMEEASRQIREDDEFRKLLGVEEVFKVADLKVDNNRPLSEVKLELIRELRPRLELANLIEATRSRIERS